MSEPLLSDAIVVCVLQHGDAVSEPGLLSDALVVVVLALVDKYRQITDMKDSTVGRLALNDSMFIPRIRRNPAGCTLEKLRRLEQWLREQIPLAEAEKAKEVA